MTHTLQPIDERLAEAAITQVRSWLVAARSQPTDAAARRLAGVLHDPNGLAFTTGFVDGVIRPEDPRVAARALTELVPLIPGFLPLPLRGAIRAGALGGRVLPRVVVPAARAVLRRMVEHLIVDASDRKLGAAITRVKHADPRIRLNLNLLGEAILGEQEAARRLRGTAALLARDDVDYVSIKVSSTVAPHDPWSFDAAVAHAVAALTPLYRQARDAAGGPKFLNLDMEEYKDLDVTMAVFTTVLDLPEFRDLEAGVVLQAYLPDALGTMHRLQDWAADRVANGGSPIKVRLVKGANLPMERVDAELHDWPLATWGSKCGSDASYLAILDYALTPEHIAAVRVGVAGHNLFDIALTWELARARGVTAGIDFEMLLGMAAAQAAAVCDTVGSLLLYTPVVHPEEFDVAIAYLIRRLEEGAAQENFMSAVFDLDTDAALFDRERRRFLDSVAAMPRDVPAPNRTQDRSGPPTPAPRTGFHNTPDSDPSIAANQAWARAIRSRVAGSTLGLATAEAAGIGTVELLDETVEDAVTAGAAWRALGADGRAEILHRVGDELDARRADLLEVMGAETGKLIDQGDAEVSEATDFAHYYAERGLELERVPGAAFHPARLTVATPPWNFPVAIPTGSTLAALASGSPVILKPAPQAMRCGAVLAEAMWAAGVPRDVLRLARVEEGTLGAHLISHPAVERVILTGGYETAELFRRLRPDLPLLAETSGKNAVIVTPSADLDLAAKDVAYSAFGHAGQKCSAASLVVLVGSVAESKRFRRQLLDAVESMRVGLPGDDGSRMGPIIAPAEGKLLRGLTRLGAGESWLLEPRPLDDTGRLWSPGVRDGVRPGSEYHRTEYFGPILGIMTAETLDDAIDLVNAVDYGLTSGLQSLDDGEITHWLGRVQAGNLYVNRGITGAIVARQPFGGWKKSAVGAGTKAGGPNYLVGLGSWTDAPVPGSHHHPDALSVSALATGLSDADDEWLAGALSTDQCEWAGEFGQVRDVTALTCEINAFRYHRVPVTIRFDAAREAELVRVVAAGARAGAPLLVSTAHELSAGVRSFVGAHARIHVEDGAGWARRVAALAGSGARVRLIGDDGAALASATVAAAGGSPLVAIYGGPVVSAGRVELLPFLREQAVSITAHRFGTPREYTVPAAV